MKRGLWLILLGLLAAGCPASSPPGWLRAVPDAEAVGVFHQVEAGQTLGKICRLYGADVQEVAEVNGIDDPDQIQAGQRIFLPDAKPIAGGARPEEPAGKGSAAAKSIKRFEGKFAWPVDGVLTSRFGIRHGRRHDGIDIGAPEGTPVRASAAGKVLFVGKQGGYGKLVIIKHADRMITVYAHNRANRVKEGQTVTQGQVIAEVGQTGRATGPHLHFEIRQATKPRNPLFFLPRPD